MFANFKRVQLSSINWSSIILCIIIYYHTCKCIYIVIIILLHEVDCGHVVYHINNDFIITCTHAMYT